MMRKANSADDPRLEPSQSGSEASDTILQLHFDEAPEDPSSIPQHVELILGKRDPSGRTYAEAVALKWIQLALQGNMTALKEILLRFAPMEESGPKTVRYVLEQVPGDDWCDEADPA